MTLQVAQDLKDEAADLYAFLKTLDPADWDIETRFMEWTPWDVVAHLHYFDKVSHVTFEGEEAFAPERNKLGEMIRAGKTNKETAREALGHLDGPALLEAWKKGCDELADKLAARSPKDRLPWFGPDMGVQMFTTARYMETWAHGQEIYDLKKASRTHTDRIKNIVAIGIKTYGWTFVNRKLEIPGPPPYVRLTAPSGEVWEYNEPSEAERIEGPAVDFCQTVTQVRNVRDTDLRVEGVVANQWMDIAQCFAGAPVDPPKPGSRVGA